MTNRTPKFDAALADKDRLAAGYFKGKQPLWEVARATGHSTEIVRKVFQHLGWEFRRGGQARAKLEPHKGRVLALRAEGCSLREIAIVFECAHTAVHKAVERWAVEDAVKPSNEKLACDQCTVAIRARPPFRGATVVQCKRPGCRRQFWLKMGEGGKRAKMGIDPKHLRPWRSRQTGEADG